MDKLKELRLKQIEIVGFRKLLSLTVFQSSFLMYVMLDTCLGSLFVGQEATILSFTSHFFVYVKVFNK